MSQPRRVLAVFAKTPVPGQVKSRLARRLGRAAAAGAYKRLLRHTLSTAALVDADLELWCTPGRHPWLTRQARRYGAEARVQPHGDLGNRMHRVMCDSLHSGRLPVIIGGDCAPLDNVRVQAAFRGLEAGSDAVFVPAEDGGYTLVGVRRPLPALFRGIPWGGPAVMRCTRRALIRQRLDWLELPPSYDVDDYADYRRWLRGARHWRFR